MNGPATTPTVFLLVAALFSGGCGGVKHFELASVDGKETYSNEMYKGKVLMLDYWATWCGPCRQLQPIVHEMADMYGKRGLVVLGVTDEAPGVIAKFVEQTPLGYPAVIDRGGRVAKQFHVQALPTVIVIDRGGNVVFNEAGPDPKRVGELLDRLLPAH